MSTFDLPGYALALAEQLPGTWTVEYGHHGDRDRYLIGPDHSRHYGASAEIPRGNSAVTFSFRVPQDHAAEFAAYIGAFRTQHP